MEELLVIFGLIIFVVFLIVPILSLVKILSLSKEIGALHAQLNFLSTKLEQLLSRKEQHSPTIQEKTVVRSKPEPVPEPAPQIIESTLPCVIEKPLQPEEPQPEISLPEVPEITGELLPEEEVIPVTYSAAPAELSVEPPVAEIPAEEPLTALQPEPVPPVHPSGKKSGFPELLWGENLLSKIGIITFVLGIAFFVKYAIDKDWINETGRVGIGLLVGAAIIGTAHKLRKQYDVFSAILCGGGFAVFYITITLAFREYLLIPQTAAFILLILITIACVIFSMLYDKKELALFSLLGGFGAPFMVSTGSGNYMVLFTYILILNSGMIWLAFKKKWQLVGVATFVLSQIVIWLWLLTDFTDQYGGTTLFLLAFFIQFYALAVADHLKNPAKITPYQAMIILWNNLSLFIGCYYIFRNYPVDVNGVFTIGMALMNGAVLFLLFNKKGIDKLLVYLVIAIVLSLATLAVPIQLEGNAISMFWAAEMAILLFLWLHSRIPIFKYGLYGIIVLLGISYLIDLSGGYTISRQFTELPVIINRYFITGVVITVAAAVCYYLLKREIRIHGIAINRPYDPVTVLYRGFYYSLYILIFLVPFCEINYQLRSRLIGHDINSLVYSILLTYTYIYLAIVFFLKKERILQWQYGLLFFAGSILFYTVAMMFTLTGLRETVFIARNLPEGWFSIHLLSLPAIGYIIYQLFAYILPSRHKEKENLIWFLVIFSVILITCESDNLACICMSPFGNYYKLLRDIHTFGYPVLWGLLAMGLMIWGLKTKQPILRKISLVFFGFIIVKFYLYDVWRMSQGGRIVSFVLLGLILLVVSFMQQKIRRLVKDENKEEVNEEKKE
ncbi:MAG: DUF2339 domain-containing protein [Tannerellaceae bacterium]|nr:DUF2339 domain-containing protein [Tannerellaceae bacterium]